MGQNRDLSRFPNAITVLDNGNVGIGTTSFSEGTQPTGTISIIPNSSVSSGPLVQFAGNGRIRPASTGDRLSIDGNALFLNSTFNANIIMATGGGRVGIGTASPGYLLDVTNGSNPSLRVRNGALGGTATLLLETANDFTGTCQAYVRVIGSTGNGQSALTFGTAGAIGDTTATERMRLGNDGSLLVQSSANPIIRVRSDNQYVNAVVSASWDTGSGSAMEMAYNPNSAVGFIQNTYPITSGQVYGDINFRQNSAGTMVTRMTIKADGGQVLKPSNPAFRAYYSVNGSWFLSNNDTFIFNLTEYNIGNCYNTSNGRFTAPVAGVYQFNFYSIYYGPTTNSGVVFRKNGGAPTSGFNMHYSNSVTGWDNVNYTTSIYLNAGDYVFIVSIGAVQYHGDDWSSFSGYLVG